MSSLAPVSVAARQVGPKTWRQERTFSPQTLQFGLFTFSLSLASACPPRVFLCFWIDLSLCLSLPLSLSLLLSLLFTLVSTWCWPSAGPQLGSAGSLPHGLLMRTGLPCTVKPCFNGSVWEEPGGHCIFLKRWSWKSHSIASANLHLRPTHSRGGRGPPPSGGCRL